MKNLVIFSLIAVVLTGCNAMTNLADKTMKDKRNPSFNSNPATIYPTADGSKDGNPAEFSRQAF